EEQSCSSSESDGSCSSSLEEQSCSSSEFDASSSSYFSYDCVYSNERLVCASKTYSTVTIGNQTWTRENMAVALEGAFCYSSASSCDSLGYYYAYSAASNACPTGWHLPSGAEWDTLIENVGGVANAGRVLKAITGWNSSSSGSDAYSFSAVPAGKARICKYIDVTRSSSSSGTTFSIVSYTYYNDVGSAAYWWTTDLYSNSSQAYSRYITTTSDSIKTGLHSSKDPISSGSEEFLTVRCVMDSP
ncbi:MAG TPA: FISUMP domain-containing protein, partial [Fibrobacteraceae bacterium]|nr:FISUMP domain-containing protein [Fibrobacteraceae bacterium]